MSSKKGQVAKGAAYVACLTPNTRPNYSSIPPPRLDSETRDRSPVRRRVLGEADLRETSSLIKPDFEEGAGYWRYFADAVTAVTTPPSSIVESSHAEGKPKFSLISAEARKQSDFSSQTNQYCPLDALFQLSLSFLLSLSLPILLHFSSRFLQN